MAGGSPLDRDRWQAVSPYLDRAMELDPDELGPWLKSLRTDQPALAADLELLLDDRAALSDAGFLEDGAAGRPAAAPGLEARATALTAPQAQPGTLGTVGPYRLLRPLGEGGMGIVFLAEQVAPIRRDVALKLIKPGMDTKQVLTRFDAERQALALMDHPSVSRVLDAGSTEDGRPFFAMEYVPGVPITEHCDRQMLTTRERLELFLQVCDGVQHAHQKAIIHRDLKPSNVLVSLRDDVAVPKVIDFGVAKATARRLTEETLHTEASVLIGTPDYMSPEQADPTVEDVDTRTDVYSLGAMLYELLVGALPFEPRALREAGVDGIRRMIREVEPPKPSTRLSVLGAERSADTARRRRVDPATLRRLLAGELDWIVMKAVEKDRGRRYGSPAELAADVRRYLGHEPVLAAAPSAVYRARKFVRRHWFAVAAVSAALLALVGFAATMAVQARRIAREAEAKRRLSEFLTELFEVTDPGKARGEDVTARELLDRGTARIRETLADDPRMRAELMATMGAVYTKLGLYAQAEPLLEEALETRQHVLGRDDLETLRTAREMANLRFRRGRFEEAEALSRETLGTCRRVLGPEHEDTLRSMGDLALVYWQQARHGESLALTRQVLEIQERVLGSDHVDTLSSMRNLAWNYQSLGRHGEAEALHRQVLDTRKRVLGTDHPNTLVSMSSLAVTYHALGRYGEAEALARETLDTQKRVIGAEHPNTLVSMSILAAIYFEQGRNRDAELLTRETLDVQKRVLGPEHPNTLASMTNLAAAYNRLGRREEAAALQREILETDKRVLGPEHPDTLIAMSNLAATWDEQGRHVEAERLHRETLDIRRRALGPEHPETLASLTNLAQALASLGRHEEAEGLDRQTLAVQRRVLGPAHPDTLLSLYNLACLTAARGARPETLGLLREAAANGFAEPSWLLEDSALASVRGDPEFEKILAAALENQQRTP